MNKITLHDYYNNGRIEIYPEDIRCRCETDCGTLITIGTSKTHSFGKNVVETFDKIDDLIAESRCESHAVIPAMKVPVKGDK